MTNPTIRTIALTTILAAVLGFFMGVYFLKHGLIGTPISIAKLADGAIYTGDTQNGLLHGEGTLRWPEGSFYEGAFKDGLLHGQGEYVDVSGNRYVGQFIEGQFSGRGTIQLKDGGIYEGQTKGWQMDGEGEYRFERSVYRGTFEEDALTGQGEYLEDGELMYRGSFRDWTFHGDGERFEEGGHWQGEFEDGLMTQGTHILDTGGRYEGEVSFRTYHGDGTLTLANGDRYVGEFHYGEYHGEGSMYLAKEQEGIIEYSGKWRDGVLVESPQNHLVKNYEAQLESALYREADLLQEELSRVPAGDPSKVELYFLGIAGDGTQRVFSREVKAFRDYFDNVLPLDARQVNLINDRESIGKRPLATSTSIEQALAKLATSMNLDQDLLVVYISSHGSSEHEISLANEAIRLGDLSATSLSEMLTRSGIRWQVIFVSSCYSGGFIEPLQNPGRLIMTASASDKTSFGCSDEAEMTYFGQALLESLSMSQSFGEAFDKLKIKISARETAEDISTSDPQLFVGDAISKRLPTILGLFKRQLP